VAGRLPELGVPVKLLGPTAKLAIKALGMIRIIWPYQIEPEGDKIAIEHWIARQVDIMRYDPDLGTIHKIPDKILIPFYGKGVKICGIIISHVRFGKYTLRSATMIIRLYFIGFLASEFENVYFTASE